jgi:hypothetical protein
MSPNYTYLYIRFLVFGWTITRINGKVGWQVGQAEENRFVLSYAFKPDAIVGRYVL